MTNLLRREMGLVKGEGMRHELWSGGLEKKMFFTRKEEEDPWHYSKFVYDKNFSAMILGKETVGGVNDYSQM